jgi:hypothetical protein
MLNRLAPKTGATKQAPSGADLTGENFSMRAGALPGALRAIVALVCALAALPAAQAQDIRITAPSAGTAASPPANPTDDPQASQPLTPDESAVLGNALLFDPANLAATKSARPLRLPSLSKPRDLDVNRTDKSDGSSTVVVKQPLATTDWDAHVGADLNTAAPPPTSFQPGEPFPGTVDGRGSGAAWASVGVPNLASVDARVDPANDQGKLGTTLKHSVPLGKEFSVTVQNRYSVTETFSAPVTAPASPSGLALMAAPPPAEPAAQGPAQVWGNEKSVKFNIQPTGTTLAAGITTASNDPVIHNTISADQKVFGPLHVTTAVSDIGQPVTNKSITAGFKLNW